MSTGHIDPDDVEAAFMTKEKDTDLEPDNVTKDQSEKEEIDGRTTAKEMESEKEPKQEKETETEKKDGQDIELQEVNPKSNNETAGDGDGKTDTVSTPLKPKSPQSEEKETDFEPMTTDISFSTKVGLLLWKNYKIQVQRRKKSCCMKICVPTFIMFIMFLFTLIEGLREDVGMKYGVEKDYLMGTSGDAAQYAQFNEQPWPDTSIANQWIGNIVCTYSNGRRGGGYDQNGLDPPSYIAIVHPDINNLDDNDNLKSLLNTLRLKYGENTEYDGYDGSWFDDVNDNEDWYWYEKEYRTNVPTNSPTISPTDSSSSPTITTSSPTPNSNPPTTNTNPPTTSTSSPTSITSGPTSATSTPTASTSNPTTTTSNPTATTSSPTSSTNNPSSSPTSTTSTPTTATSSPTSTTSNPSSSPTSITGSPTATTSAPTATTGSPTTSPTVSTSSPTATTSSPTSTTTSPTGSPTTTTNSPTALPTATTSSPTATTASPSVSPTVTTNSPTATTGSPTSSPTATTTSPTATTSSPTESPIGRRRRNLLQSDDTNGLENALNYFFPDSNNTEDVACINGIARNTDILNWEEGSLLIYFETESELEAYIESSKYGNSGFNFVNDVEKATRPIGAAIVFDETGGDDGTEWHYTLRFNSSNIPSTKTSIDIFTRDVDDLYNQYQKLYASSSAFPWLQTWLDEGIMQLIIEDTYSGDELAEKLDRFNFYTKEYSKGFFQFPTAPYVYDGYWPNIGQNFPFFCFIMFCYPIIVVLSTLVQEKQSKIKEGMKMMGATTSAYWTSWFLWFFIEFTLMAFFVSVLGVGGGVFRYSSFGVIFIWFELFTLSAGAFACMFSTLFDNPKTGSLCGLIIFFAVLIGGQFSGTLDAGGKRGLCLLAPACFVTSLDTLTQYEQYGIGINWDNVSDEYNNFTFGTSLGFMFLDLIIYIILTIYLDQVFPSRYGQKQVAWFFLLPSYWKKKCGAKQSDEENIQLKRQISAAVNNPNYEDISDNDRYGEPLIAIRNLSKTFTAFGLTRNGRKEVKAVQKISLDMYRGEIFCLLGHNGAGKTTTIGMMTGLLDISGGSAWILKNNVGDPSAMGEIRKHLGVCPQHDVLWDKLTTKEHLWLFARLKGVPKNLVNDEVNKIAESTGLSADGNDNKFPIQMSGGQRRKLSLGIALIGGSQIVFLDEPTSGMDPQSRRVTWDLISKEKKKRCIILTTHFMDEADILGDRIAIMGSGKVKCCGSGLYLKRLYGVGYTFTVSLKPSDDNAKEVNNLKAAVDKQVYDQINNAQDVALAGSELTYRLPFEETGSFSKLFDSLDKQKDELQIKSYGISVTTLEEVFLKIGHDEIDDEVDIDSNGNTSKKEEKSKQIEMDIDDRKDAQIQFAKPELSNFALKDKGRCTLFFIHVYAILFKRFWWSIRDFKALVCALFCPVILSAMALGLLTIQIAETQPDIILSTSDWYSDPSEVLMYVPENTLIPSGNQTIYDIANNFFSSNNTLYDSFVDYLQDDVGQLLLEDIPIDIEGVFNGDYIQSAPEYDYIYPSTEEVTYEFQDYLLDLAYSTHTQMYNAFFFHPYSMTPNIQNHVLFGINGSSPHGIPITINVWNNWILRDIMGDDANPSITISNHPLPVTERQDLVSSSISGFFAALYLVIAFSFIPAGAIYFMVNEKTNLTKHQQLVSGISITAYWTSNYIADLMVGLPASILVFISVYIFDADAFQGDAAGPFFFTLLMFLIAALPFTYLLSFLFTSPSKAQLTTILIYIMFGMILGLASFILDFISATSETNADLKPLYRIFPVFLMSETLLNISLKAFIFPFDDYSSWDVSGRNWTLMLIEGCGYFSLVLFIEYLGTFPKILTKLGFVTNRPITEQDSDLDEDVVAEKKRILAGIITDGNGNISIDKDKLEDTVILSGLRKVYDPAGGNTKCCSKVADHKKIEAVKNLHFGVKQSEVFGFLGVNGAGKTTTLATLTGERYASSGDAFIANFPISNQLSCRRYVGYCPQFDAIFDLLTASEHLKFYAMIKGINPAQADEQVKVLLSALTLNKYSDRVAGTYSGGNKRKLSVAVSMIGNPPVIFLDEPSTGMDPVSRRFMWEFISTTMSGRCVILTTHSMEECEALCNRVGIMVNGQLKCIGTAQHLKQRYGEGFQLDVTLDTKVINDYDEKESEQTMNELITEFKSAFGNVSLIERNGTRISYQLHNSDKLRLGEMFNSLEHLKENKFKGVLVAYALSQTTLEQIFIRMAKKGEKEMEQEQKRINEN